MPYDPKRLILANAERIVQLHKRIKETYVLRDTSPDARAQWSHACAEFHASYDELAFPGGWNGAKERMLAGDADTIEAGICFLETRPYFFRSGYMFHSLLRIVKRAPLSDEQAARLQAVRARCDAWREAKKGKTGK